MAALGLVPLDGDNVARTSGNACLVRKTASERGPSEAVWLTGEEPGAGFHSSNTLATSNVLRITSARPQT